MVIKKKIIKLPCSKEEVLYYDEASICPFCKNNDMVKVIPNNNYLVYSPHIDYTRTMYYECNMCGCKWKVKPFKRKAKWSKKKNKNE